MTTAEIDKMQKDKNCFEVFEEFLVLHRQAPKDFNIFIKLLFQNWYCLTLTTNRPKQIEEKLIETLPELTNFGLTNFIDKPEFLVVFTNLCSRLFFYLFGVSEKFGEELCEGFITKYPNHPIAQLYSLQGILDETLRDKISNKKAEIREYILTTYPSDELFDKYFRELFS